MPPTDTPISPEPPWCTYERLCSSGLLKCMPCDVFVGMTAQTFYLSRCSELKAFSFIYWRFFIHFLYCDTIICCLYDMCWECKSLYCRCCMIWLREIYEKMMCYIHTYIFLFSSLFIAHQLSSAFLSRTDFFIIMSSFVSCFLFFFNSLCMWVLLQIYQSVH